MVEGLRIHTEENTVKINVALLKLMSNCPTAYISHPVDIKFNNL